MTVEQRGRDGSSRRAVQLPGDDRVVEVWDTARVVAGEPATLVVVAVADTGRHAHRWERLASRWAGPPFWGSGPPPRPAIGTGDPPRRPDAAPGTGPDGTPSWTGTTRVVVVPGSRGDRGADATLLTQVLERHGPADALLGHGEGARLVQVASPGRAATVLLDGGLPLGPDRADVDVERSWTRSPPGAVILASAAPARYDDPELRAFLARHPDTPWRRLGGGDRPGLDHDRLVDDPRAVMVLPGLVRRVRNGWADLSRP